MQKIYTLAVPLFIGLVFASCSGGRTNTDSDNAGNVPELVAGKISGQVKCRTNPEFSYIYYLPKGFNPNRKYPLILVFDAQARSRMAIERFVYASDNYGYIVAASDHARNGITDINPIINALWEDVVNRLPVDQSRVYTAGFSGGARIAAAVAIYKGGVKGVIACGAGMPEPGQGISTKFNYIGVVGLGDMNYQELKSLDKALQKNGFVSQLVTHNGGHEWPDNITLSNAVAWQELMAMKLSQIPINDKLVRDYTVFYADSINKLIMNGFNYEAHMLYSYLLRDLDGLYDITDYQKSYEALLKNPLIGQNIALNAKLDTEEHQKQAKILEWFKSANFAGLKNEALGLQKLALSAQTYKLYQTRRLLGFMGMLSFLYTEKSLNSQNQANFKGYMEVYEILEPANPDIPYFRACQAVMDNLPEKALNLIQKAVDQGFFDVRRLQTVGYFEQLRQKPEFDQIIQKTTENFNTLK
jgi:predicted esterase